MRKIYRPIDLCFGIKFGPFNTIILSPAELGGKTNISSIRCQTLWIIFATSLNQALSDLLPKALGVIWLLQKARGGKYIYIYWERSFP